MKRLAIRASLTTLSLAALAMLVGINPATVAASPKPAAPHVTQMGVRGAAIRAAATPLLYQGGAVETAPVLYIS